jgi:A/G-specific adenine glycosylase
MHQNNASHYDLYHTFKRLCEKFYHVHQTFISLIKVRRIIMQISKELGNFFSGQLLAWFRIQKRDLPWRQNKDPYRIWVSEIMLQQTRVDTVIPYYERFMDKFPTIEALASAPEDEVLKAWEGLGYYSRARNLQTAVREVSELYGGKVPDNPEEISSLRGVGPYTAGAILSIAYNRPEPAVDGNVMRVLSRMFLIEDDIAKPATRVRMEKVIRQLIPSGAAGDFNQAIMELGALVCTPKSPHCLTCPVMERCEGRLAGKELELPVKTRAKAPRQEYRAVALIEGTGDNRGKILLRKRPSEGLLAGMWELPHVLLAGESLDGSADVLPELLKQEAGLAVRPIEHFRDIDHIFSHIRWWMRVFRCQGEVLDSVPSVSAGIDQENTADMEVVWIDPADRSGYTLPNVFNRILDEYVDRI